MNIPIFSISLFWKWASLLPYEVLFFLIRIGYVDYSIALDLASYLVNEEDYVPWKSYFKSITYIDNLLSTSSCYGLFQVTFETGNHILEQGSLFSNVYICASRNMDLHSWARFTKSSAGKMRVLFLRSFCEPMSWNTRPTSRMKTQQRSPRKNLPTI